MSASSAPPPAPSAVASSPLCAPPSLSTASVSTSALQLPVDLSLPVTAGIICLLTHPAAGGGSGAAGPGGRHGQQPLASPSAEAENDPPPAWVSQVRAVFDRCCSSASLPPSHVVCTRGDWLASAVVALLQDSLEAHGLPRAQMFLTSEAAPTPRAMLHELLSAWMTTNEQKDDAGAHANEGGSEDNNNAAARNDDGRGDEDEDEGEDGWSTPLVTSRSFARSIRTCPFPRVLVLAPGLRHSFNAALHARLQSLDANARRRDANAAQSHVYHTDAPAKAAGLTASDGSAPTVAGIKPASHENTEPLVALGSSVFGVSLAADAPVMLEYVLYRSALSGVWAHMDRLQRALETRLVPFTTEIPVPAAARTDAGASVADKDAATASSPATSSVTLMRLQGTHYPHPLFDAPSAFAAASPSLATAQAHSIASAFVVRHSRIVTGLSIHTLHSVLLVAAEANLLSADEGGQHGEQPLPQLGRRASTRQEIDTAMWAERAAREAALHEANRARLREAMRRVGELRTLGAHASPRLCCFDSSASGRATATLLASECPSFSTGMARFSSLLSSMAAFESVVTAPTATLSEHIFVGSDTHLAPLLSLLLNDGRRNNLHVKRRAVEMLLHKHGGVVDVQLCRPELPSKLLLRQQEAPNEANANASADADADSDEEAAQATGATDAPLSSQSHLRVSRVLNGQYVPLSRWTWQA